VEHRSLAITQLQNFHIERLDIDAYLLIYNKNQDLRAKIYKRRVRVEQVKQFVMNLGTNKADTEELIQFNTILMKALNVQKALSMSDIMLCNRIFELKDEATTEMTMNEITAYQDYWVDSNFVTSSKDDECFELNQAIEQIDNSMKT
jgi:hypothetical protein